MKYNLLLVLAIILSSLYSCEDEPYNLPEAQVVEIDDFSAIQLLFSSIEYDLYIGEKALANVHANELKNRVAASTKMYCDEEFLDLQDLVRNLGVYADQILKESEERSLDRLRDLKGQYILMETQDDYDTYLYHLWSYEENMYYTTKAAIDPKLDLYEWGEFKLMVDCMNADWEMVRLHYPSIELFGNNELGYKIQSMAKIHLQEAMKKFNTAVESNDYIKYDLCDHGEAIREAYVRYIRTFVSQEKELSPFLATI
jgi:hypothetical protein